MNNIIALLLVFVAFGVDAASSFGGRSFSSPARSFSSSSSSFSRATTVTSTSKSSTSSVVSGIKSTPKLYERVSTARPSLKVNNSYGKFDPSVFSSSYRQNRRASYYNGYTPSPTYTVVNAGSNYGPWDSLLMWSMLDNVGDRQMYYHHQNDPYFQQWRADAEKVAQTNPEVAQKLKSLDADVQSYRNKGVSVNPNYVTNGVDPDIYEANNIDFSKINEVKICTGSNQSEFDSYASKITNITNVKVVKVPSNGSVDNLEKLAKGECDMAFTQNDVFEGYNSIKKILTIDKEEGTLLFCPKTSNINTFADLKEKKPKIKVASTQTGSIFTLTNLLKSNSIDINLEEVSLIEKEFETDSCIFTVASANSFTANVIDKTKYYNLVQIRKNAVLANNFDDVYADRGDFPNSTKETTLYNYFSKHGTDVLGVKTSLVTTDSWIEQNKLGYDIFIMNKVNLEEGIE